MATKLEKIKWQLHKQRYNILFYYGVTKGLIRPYD